MNLKNNERNTKFFHRVASLRRRRNFIGKIKIRGRMVSNQAKIKEGVVDFFENVFYEEDLERPKIQDLNFKRIDAEMQIWFERPLEEEEILLAIKSLGKEKSPVPMVFPLLFFLNVGSL